MCRKMFPNSNFKKGRSAVQWTDRQTNVAKLQQSAASRYEIVMTRKERQDKICDTSHVHRENCLQDARRFRPSKQSMIYD
jgi:hypothetical protein